MDELTLDVNTPADVPDQLQLIADAYLERTESDDGRAWLIVARCLERCAALVERRLEELAVRV